MLTLELLLDIFQLEGYEIQLLYPYIYFIYCRYLGIYYF